MCGAVGCGNTGLMLLLDAPAGAESLAGAEVEYCYNSTCLHGTLPAVIVDGAYARLGGAAGWPFVTLSYRRGRHGRPYLWFQPNLPMGALHDGDRYRVTVRAGAGAVLLAHTATVEHYLTYFPNGPECGGGCQVARVDRRVTPERADTRPSK
jgi:hypothetical protein